ncbi:MAG TPA: extracellular solute-binding protein [Chloroflexota bacterium]|nr:extracellular solute-binding protein [Chloroflexota bacterium]
MTASVAAAGGSAAAQSAAFKTPAYVPFQGPKPDIAGNDQGLPPAYFSYPKTLTQSVTTPPGKGDDVSILTFTIGSPPPAVDQNTAWQAVNKALDAKLNINAVGAPDYLTKLTTAVAGGDIPDLFYVSVIGTSLQNMTDFLTASCADLTPFLSGDTIKDYPNLANIPSYRWPFGVFNGKLMAIPAATITGQSFYANGKAMDQAGIGPGVGAVKDKDDFMRLAKQMTQQGQRWMVVGTGSGYSASTTAAQNPLGFFLQVFGAPNDWKNDGGKLTKDLETPQFKEAVAYVRSLWDAGVVHPDSPSINLTQVGQLWYSGKVVLWQNSYFAFPVAADGALNQDPQFSPRFLQPFAADSSAKPIHLLGSTSDSLIAVKKGSADRVKELLGVLNFTHAPFGSQEALLISYGVKDQDFTFDAGGAPVLTKQGQTNVTTFPIWRFGAAPAVIYDTNAIDHQGLTAAQQRMQVAQVLSKAESEAISIGVKSPVTGLYSKTASTKNAQLMRSLTDGLNNIIYGRNDVSSFDQLVKDWQNNGGNDIRNEYQQALQSAK